MLGSFFIRIKTTYMKINDNITITNEDNMALMARYPDNYFDIAIVDPEYGKDIANMNLGNGKNSWKKSDWDKKPSPPEYFTELFRVSKNQIIWGANYFIDNLKPTKCMIVWDKNNGSSSFADGELAWTSFDKNLKIYKVHWCGSAAKQETGQNKIHPAQKPIKLYEKIFIDFAKKDFKIIDTHLGSGNIIKALDKVNKHDKMNLSIVACEIDKEYFEKSIINIRQETTIMTLF